MKLSSILNTLQGQEIFKNLSQEEFNYIFEISEIKNFEKEEYLFHQSMPREAMYVILEGRLAILQGIGDQSTQKAVYKKGSLISERILRSDHSPHATSGQALTTLTVLEITNYALNLMEKFNKPLQEKLVHNAFENYSERMSFKGIKNGSGADSDYRVEHDLLGDRQVPMDALYGVQTLRALENFPITNEHIGVYPSLIRALAMVKKACALSNRDLKLLDEDIAKVIIQACDEIIDGAHSEHFVVDVMQGGAGTSTNMNANEVICNRALELMGKKRGEYKFIHPNNHVNLSQSTNDVYPTALRIALRFAVKRLQASMKQLSKHFSKKALEFKSVIKMGRTQLQDAVPMTLGQEFEAFALMIMEDYERLDESKPLLEEINMGATAIGTGLNADPRYARMVRQYLEEVAGMEMKTAHNLVEATQDTGSFVQLSGVLKRFAVKISKICNDLRLLSSGPRAGFNEINLPPVQPGSSIMPGKVNPVIPEVVNQVAYEVVGNDVTITMASEAGQLQLNVMEPVIAWSLFKSINHLRQACIVLGERTVKGITANADITKGYVDNSIGIVTALLPTIGYVKSTEVAKEAINTGKSVKEILLKRKIMTKDEIEDILKPENMVVQHWDNKRS